MEFCGIEWDELSLDSRWNAEVKIRNAIRSGVLLGASEWDILRLNLIRDADRPEIVRRLNRREINVASDGTIEHGPLWV